MLTRKQAKTRLKTLGWTYRAVAPVLGVSHTHLALVLTENVRHQRTSHRLLAAIAKLPPRERRKQ